MDFGSVQNGLWFSAFRDFGFGSFAGLDNLTFKFGSLTMHFGN